MSEYEIILAIDSNEQRGRAQAQTIIEMPLDWETVHVTLLHAFTDKPEPEVSAKKVVSVRRAAELLEDHGIETSYLDADGDPTTAIERAVDDRDADLLVVAGRKRTPAGKALFGSVTQNVILDLDCPVLVCESEDEATATN